MERKAVQEETSDEQKKVTLTLSSQTESSIRTLITSAYRQGYDIVTVQFDDPEKLRILEGVVERNLIGFEVTKKESNTCTVECVAELTKEQFDLRFPKIFLHIKELFVVVRACAKNRSQEGLNEIKTIEARIQSCDNLCRRVMKKHQLFTDNAYSYWVFRSLLMHGQREIYHAIQRAERVWSDGALLLLLSAEEMFLLLERAYNGKDIEGLGVVHDQEKVTIYEEGYPLLENIPQGEAGVRHHLLSSVRQFYLANSPLTAFLLTQS